MTELEVLQSIETKLVVMQSSLDDVYTVLGVVMAWLIVLTSFTIFQHFRNRWKDRRLFR